MTNPRLWSWQTSSVCVAHPLAFNLCWFIWNIFTTLVIFYRFEHFMLSGKKVKWICLAFWLIKKKFAYTFTYIWVVHPSFQGIITLYQMKWITAWLKNMHAFSTPKLSISTKWQRDTPLAPTHMNYLFQ